MDADIFGLVTWRQRKRISLETIAENTKLSIRHLKAIEAGEFRKLPGGIYDTNYIRQYARAIGFDEVQLLSFYRGRAVMQA